MLAEERRSPHEAGSGYIDNLGGFDDTSEKSQAHGLLARWMLIGAACLDSELSHGDTAVLWTVIERMGPEGLSWPGYDRIAADTQLHRATAVRSVAKLVARDYLQRERGGFGKSNRYRVGSRTAATIREDATSRIEPAAMSRTDATSGSSVDATRTHYIEPTSCNPLKDAKRKASRAGTSERFAEFWSAYPRKIGPRKKAEQTWRSKQLDKRADEILSHVRERAANDPAWSDKQYIPYPTTFLIGERWLDEWKPVRAVKVMPAADAIDYNDAALRKLGVAR